MPYVKELTTSNEKDSITFLKPEEEKEESAGRVAIQPIKN